MCQSGVCEAVRVNVCTVIGFPLGATTTESKAFEAKNAVENGADEVDMVVNVGKIKSGDWDFVKKDIEAVVQAAGGHLVKVIIETCLLTDDEKVKACLAAKEAGADFVKTSTGFSTGGAKPEDVALMRRTVGPDMGVKASGGIHTAEEAIACINAGATNRCSRENDRTSVECIRNADRRFLSYAAARRPNFYWRGRSQRSGLAILCNAADV